MSLSRRTVLAAFVLCAADSAALQPRVRALPSLRAATLSPTIVPRVAVAPRASALGTSAAIFGVANAVGLAISAAWPSCHVHLDLIGTGVFAIEACLEQLFARVTREKEAAGGGEPAPAAGSAAKKAKAA